MSGAGGRHILGEAGVQRVLVVDDGALSTGILASERRQRVVVVVDDRGGVARPRRRQPLPAP